MTEDDVRLLASRVLGKTQRYCPAWLVNVAREAIVSDLRAALVPPQVPQDADRRALTQALDRCRDILADANVPKDEAFLRCKQMMAPHFRTVGK